MSKLMILAGAFLVGLGGIYIGHRIEGEMSMIAIVAFAIGIIWLSQAPVVALRERVQELESKLGGSSSVDNA
ncbi:hypothetical protein [Massilia sp. H6]|uniref:hypothetical protein n=1 Tax=Massilia sp. H6 TaxID=2970464 RepID=UPI0021672C92|nr:hypothetical protein [Massilia sp. H6]UVW29558.1 hypothetical protein NRS07_05360 [Massilia sp. H6]